MRVSGLLAAASSTSSGRPYCRPGWTAEPSSATSPGGGPMGWEAAVAARSPAAPAGNTGSLGEGGARFRYVVAQPARSQAGRTTSASLHTLGLTVHLPRP